MSWPGRSCGAAMAVAAVFALAACTSGSDAPSSNPSPSNPWPSSPTATGSPATSRALTQKSSPSATFVPSPATSVHPLPFGSAARAGEKDKRCPYIRTGLNQDSNGYSEDTPNVADIEGDRIYRTTVLTRLSPVGCRFYFYAPPYEATADILPRAFATSSAAYNALVLTGRAGRNPQSYPNFVRGVDGINYQTRFFGPDGNRDWAFAFAKGKVLVVVHTQQDNSPLNALYLARAIAARF